MKRLPSFSVILVFVVLSIVGAASIPLLEVQYKPTKKSSTLSVSCTWSGASAKLMESEVTSVIEWLAASVSGVGNISSVSKKGSGKVTVEVKDKRRMDVVRFELATLLRQTYDKLPKGVSYPVLSGTTGGENIESVMTYTINADLPTQQIEQYASSHIVEGLSMVDGVGSVVLSGATPLYLEVAYDSDRLNSLGLSVEQLRSVLSSSLSEYDVVGSVDGIGVLLKGGVEIANLGDLPVGRCEGRIVRLSDVATIGYREREPSSYYRINGLNTINVTIYPEKDVNTITLCSAIKSRMGELSDSFPDKFSATVTYDSSEYLSREIAKIVRRTLLSIAILLVFVLIVSLSFRYLLTVMLALLANLLISLAIYALFGVQIHIYSMAGITVSLGIMIDTSIVMIAHYGYYHNRRVFIALLAAQLTTIGALSVIYLLPDDKRLAFTDFSSVIIVNLVVSLLVAMLFIPALVDTLKVREHSAQRSFASRRRTARFNRWYSGWIAFARKYRWATIVIVVLAFGLPFNKIPDGAMGGVLDKARKPLTEIFGGTIDWFFRKSSSNLYRNVERPQLYIRASLPDGCTVGQLNEIVLLMENYLSQFDQIETFKTTVSSHSSATIVVEFRPEVEGTSFPLELKSRIISTANDFGGAAWGVSGINDQYFSNDVLSNGYLGQRIIVTGYNYDELYRYCQNCLEHLQSNPRVIESGIFGEVGWRNSISRNEYFIEYDAQALAAAGLSRRDAYTALSDQLFSSNVGTLYEDGVRSDIDLVSSDKSSFDVWNLRNEHITIGNSSIPFTDIGAITMRKSGNDIYKQNQQYALRVAYSFVGSSQMAEKLLNGEVERMNASVLPVGYKAEEESYEWSADDNSNVLLLLLVVVIIYFICAILFESLTLPLAIIGLIPFSFIGLFIIFAITGCSFDQGGFASMIMLSGLVVNAGIYIVQEYREINRQRNLPDRTEHRVNSYVRAFNHKIIPTLLTILSTVLGLVPFLFDGPDEVFWYAFAIGTIGGLAFSIVGLVFLLPAWMPLKLRQK